MVVVGREHHNYNMVQFGWVQFCFHPNAFGSQNCGDRGGIGGVGNIVGGVRPPTQQYAFVGMKNERDCIYAYRARWAISLSV